MPVTNLISSANQHGAFVLESELQLHRIHSLFSPQHIILSLSESVTCCTADFGLEPRKVRRLIKSLSSALSHCKHCYVRYSQEKVVFKRLRNIPVVVEDQ